jgi:hypothetical protein
LSGGAASGSPVTPLLVVAALLAAGCGSRQEADNRADRKAAAASAAAAGLSDQLLALAPGRFDEQPLTADAARSALRSCSFGPEFAGECRQADGTPLQAAVQGGDPLLVRLWQDGRSDLDVLAGASAIRSEMLCPELTLMASESARAFRVTAPGKKDFVLVALDNQGRRENVLIYSGDSIACVSLQASLAPSSAK